MFLVVGGLLPVVVVVTCSEEDRFQEAEVGACTKAADLGRPAAAAMVMAESKRRLWSCILL